MQRSTPTQRLSPSSQNRALAKFRAGPLKPTFDAGSLNFIFRPRGLSPDLGKVMSELFGPIRIDCDRVSAQTVDSATQILMLGSSSFWLKANIGSSGQPAPLSSCLLLEPGWHGVCSALGPDASGTSDEVINSRITFAMRTITTIRRRRRHRRRKMQGKHYERMRRELCLRSESRF